MIVSAMVSPRERRARTAPSRRARCAPSARAEPERGSSHAAADPQREKRRQDADEEHRAPAPPRQHEPGDDRRRGRSRSPSALCMKPSALPRCSAGQLSDTSAAPLAHSPPIPNPEQDAERGKLRDALRQAARRGEDGVDEDAAPSGRACGRTDPRSTPKSTPPAAAATSVAEASRPAVLVDMPRSGMIDAQRERVEHDVERVEHPAERRRDEARGCAAPSRRATTRRARLTASASATGCGWRSPARSSPRPHARAPAPAPPACRRGCRWYHAHRDLRPVGRDDHALARHPTAASTTDPGSWMTASGLRRGVSDPSGS